MEVSLTRAQADYMFKHEHEVNEELRLILRAAKDSDWGLMAEHIAVLNAFSFKLGCKFQEKRDIELIKKEFNIT